MSDKSKGNVIKFLNGKIFYVVLIISFLAVALAAWAGLEGIDTAKVPNESDINSSKTPLNSAVSPDDTNDPTVSEPDSTPETDTDNAPDKETEAADGAVAAFFVRPLLGDTLKTFSDTQLQFSKTYGDFRLHTALDIVAEQGAPVVAAGNGTVTAIYKDDLLGTVIEIDHGNTVTARYCGLADVVLVNKGDTVDSSIQVGSVGTVPSEAEDGAHLHLEFYLNGKPANPENFFTDN